MKIHKLTYVLFVLVCATLGFTFARQDQPQKDKAKETEHSKQAKEARSKFPIVNYDEAEPTDPAKNAARKEKQKRYDGPSIVARKPHPRDGEVSSFYEGPGLPSLPTSKSNVIVVGTVKSGEAHLSGNKKNVYSEFTVQVDDVLKAEVSVPPDNLITVDREGGIVNYPNGQQILYRTSRENMPSVGKRYVFFLQYINQDLRILTAYELDKDRVVPLDELDQFKKFAGQDVTTFLNDIRTILSKPQG